MLQHQGVILPQTQVKGAVNPVREGRSDEPVNPTQERSSSPSVGPSSRGPKAGAKVKEAAEAAAAAAAGGVWTKTNIRRKEEEEEEGKSNQGRGTARERDEMLYKVFYSLFPPAQRIFFIV